MSFRWRSVVGLFEYRARVQAADRAVVTPGDALSYGALNAYSNAIAHFILSEVSSAQQVIPICFEPGIERVAAILGVLKAGHAFMLLDPSHPEDRLEHALRETDAPFVLSHSACSERLPMRRTRIVELHTCDLASRPTWDVERDESPDALAYVMYTSGSAGLPKGVLIEHQSVASFIDDQIVRLKLGPGSRVLQFSSPSFDAIVWEVFASLCSGATLFVPRGDGAERVAALTRTIAHWQIDTVFLTPAVLDTLEPARTPSLNTILTGGERVSAKLVQRWSERELIICYGTTETTIFTTMGRGSTEGAWPPIGFPLPHNLVCVVEPDSETLVPDGMSGELWIGGAGLARGYLNRPSEDAARFVVREHFGLETQRFFRTGDRGRRLREGQFEFLGRIDRQVKIRAQRLEPAEVEVRITEHPGVARCAVVKAGQGQGTNERLVAFVGPQAGATVTGEGLRLYLERLLPDFMVPKEFRIGGNWPLLASTKVDLDALTALANAAPQHSGESVVDPLQGLWMRVLRCSSDDEEFFRAGGDSLRAVELLRAVRLEHGVEVSTQTFFENPTLQGLAEQVRVGRGVALEKEPSTFASASNDANAPFPMTPLQKAYWVGMNGDLPLGGVPTQCCFEYQAEELDIERLEGALNHLFGAFSVLRTVTLPDGMQQVLPHPPRHYSIRLFDLRESDDRLQRLSEIEDREWSVRWETGSFPRVELCVVRLAARDFRTLVRYDFSVLDLAGFAEVLASLSLAYEQEQARLRKEVATFRDYVLQRQSASSSHARSRHYWDARLEGFPAGPRLPLRVHPSTLNGQRFGRLTGIVSPDRWRALKERSAALHITPSALLVAVYAEVLAFWSDSPRFVINLPMSHREPGLPGLDSVLGDFTQVLLLAVDAAQPGTFTERAQRIQRQLWLDLEHSAVDGVDLVRQLARRLDPSAGIAPVIFTGLAPQRESRFLTRNALGTQVGGTSSTPQLWIDYQLREFDGKLLLFWDHVEALFPPGLMNDMFAANQRLIAALADDASAWDADPHAIAGLLMPEAQRQRRSLFNETAKPQPSPKLADLVRESIARYSASTALIAGNRTMTYAELGGEAELLAQRWHGRGLRSGELVAIVSEKGWQQIVGTLAIVLAGAAYVPLSASLPEQRKRALLEQSGARWLVTAIDAIELVAIERVSPVDEEGTESLAYVIYTSGSTGVPKGVAMPHEAVVNTIVDINQRFAIAPSDRVFGISELSFDLSVWDIFGTLSAGATLVLPGRDAAREPDEWLALCAKHGVTVWNSVPQLFSAFLQETEAASRCCNLRLVMLSGDFIPLDLPTRARRIWPSLQLMSLGGATEAAIWSIVHPIEAVDPEWQSVPYGTPLANQHCYVLDDLFRESPDWTRGEIYIGGAGLAQRYLGAAEQTDAQFIRHPATGERLYRTGDIGRMQPQGWIEILGRRDSQVKINGFRIELGEVEAAARGHEGVKSAVAIALGAPGSNRRLVLWVEAAGTLDKDALLAHLSGTLPGYMVPAAVHLCESLPLTENGKVDREQLAKRAQSAAAPALPAADPQNAGRSRILEVIWCSVLGLPAIAPDDRFFELGGDSILAMQVVSRARRHGLHLKVRDFYVAPTLRGLAALCRDEGPETAGQFSGEVRIFPGQRWFLDQGLLDAHLWHEGHVLLPSQPLDALVLEKALRALHLHHEALRSRFTPPSNGSGWRQHVTVDVPAFIFSRAEIEIAEGSELLNALSPITEALQSRLDLSTGPLLACALIDIAGGGQAVVLVGHHLVIDGYSWRVLIEDLQDAYRHHAGLASVQFQDKTTSIQRWGELLQARARTEAVAAEVAYWRATVKRAGQVRQENGRAQPRAESTLSLYSVLSPADTSSLLSALLREPSISARDVVLTALLRAMGCGANGTCMDVLTHGRRELDEQASVTRTVGRFTSVYPTVLVLDPTASRLEQAREVRQQLESAPNGGTNYGLLRYLNNDDSLESPASMCFNYAGRFDQVLSGGLFEKLLWMPRSTPNMRGVRRYEIEWNVGVLNYELAVEWRFSENIHDAKLLHGWTEACVSELRALIAELGGSAGDRGGWSSNQ